MSKEKEFWDRIESRVRGFSGETGIVIRGLENDFHFAYNEKKSMPTASAAKVFVLGTLLELCEQQKISLDQMMVLKKEDLTEGSGILLHMSPGMQLCVKDAAMLMIIVSDNTATNMLIDLVGGTETIRNHLECHGICHSSVNRKITDDPEIVSKSNFGDATAEDFAGYLWKIRNGEILSPSYALLVEDMMKRQLYKDMFGRKLPLTDYYDEPDSGRVELANKTGFVTGVRTDIGYIKIKGKGEYVYAVTTNGCKDLSYALSNEASVLISEIGLNFYRTVCSDKSE